MAKPEYLYAWQDTNQSYIDLYAWSYPDITYTRRNTFYTTTETPYKGDVLYDANKQIVTDVAQNLIETSNLNNINWQDEVLGSRNWTSVALGNGLYVAISADHYISTSTDGFHWSVPTLLPYAYQFHCIRYANNIFMAISSEGKIITSTDGTNWSLVADVGNYSWRRIIFKVNTFMIMSETGYISKSSDNGITWTTPTDMLGNYSWNCLSAMYPSNVSNKNIFAVGSSTSSNTIYFATSSDFETWTVSSFSSTGNHMYVSGSYSNFCYNLMSTDGYRLTSNMYSTTNWGNPVATFVGNHDYRDYNDSIYIGYSGYIYFSTTSKKAIGMIYPADSVEAWYLRDTSKDIYGPEVLYTDNKNIAVNNIVYDNTGVDTGWKVGLNDKYSFSILDPEIDLNYYFVLNSDSTYAKSGKYYRYRKADISPLYIINYPYHFAWYNLDKGIIVYTDVEEIVANSSLARVYNNYTSIITNYNVRPTTLEDISINSKSGQVTYYRCIITFRDDYYEVVTVDKNYYVYVTTNKPRKIDTIYLGSSGTIADINGVYNSTNPLYSGIQVFIGSNKNNELCPAGVYNCYVNLETTTYSSFSSLVWVSN